MPMLMFVTALVIVFALVTIALIIVLALVGIVGRSSWGGVGVSICNDGRGE